MIVTDDDSKFKNEFKKACKILKIRHYTASKSRHETILVKRFNIFFNAGLKVFNNDRKSTRVFFESANMLVYKWNS